MGNFTKIVVPEKGEPIRIHTHTLKLDVPLHPIIPFIEGEGIGPEIMAATRRVLDAAVARAYGDSKTLIWMEIYAGEKAKAIYPVRSSKLPSQDRRGENNQGSNGVYGDLLPQETLDAIREFVVALKSPLGTPVGSGYRSLNVLLRRKLDLYACVRPVRYFPGIPSALKNPEKVDIVIFRENVEDVYAGWEWQEGTTEAHGLIGYLNQKMGTSIRLDSGIGIKPISLFGTKRLVRKAIQWAFAHNGRDVTIMHKGNIMKYTEGAFREWGYEVAKTEFGDRVVTEDEVWEKHNGKVPEGMLLLKDRIADNMFQQIITRPQDYHVVVAPNLNGDYLSEAAASLVGGLGVAPGANIGDHLAIFEATHGTAPKYAGKNIANPTGLILSGLMLLEYIGWTEAAKCLRVALEKTFASREVTQDFAREIKGVTALSTTEFAEALIAHMA